MLANDAVYYLPGNYIRFAPGLRALLESYFGLFIHRWIKQILEKTRLSKITNAMRDRHPI